MTKVFWGVFLALFALTAIIAVLFFLGVIDFASAVNQVAEQNAQWVQAAMVAQRQAVVREQQLRQCVRQRICGGIWRPTSAVRLGR